MGSIFDEILEGVFTNNDGNVRENTLKSDMREALLRNIAKSIADMPMLLKCEHKPGSDDATTEIKGHPVAIMTGMHKLLHRAALLISEGNKEAAVEYIRGTCEQVINEILSGGGIEDVQDTAEETED